MSDRTDENRKKMISPYASFLLFNFVFFMLDTTASYFQIYLSDIGLTKTMIGTVTGTASLVALVFQPIFGAAADASKSKTHILQLLLPGQIAIWPSHWRYTPNLQDINMTRCIGGSQTTR